MCKLRKKFAHPRRAVGFSVFRIQGEVKIRGGGGGDRRDG